VVPHSLHVRCMLFGFVYLRVVDKGACICVGHKALVHAFRRQSVNFVALDVVGVSLPNKNLLHTPNPGMRILGVAPGAAWGNAREPVG
jgi:hypothetical protein